MRHARAEALDALANLLEAIRAYDVLQERTPGSFYYKRKGFLHFHEDPAGLFADVKCGQDWERMRASTASERRAVLARARELSSTA